MTTPRYSFVNSSRITRTTSVGSWYTSDGALARDATFEICSHWARSRSTSRRSSTSVAPSAAVRTINPASGGRRPSSTRRSRLRSSSGRRFEIPYVSGWPGTMTTKRPAKLTSWVRRAPFAPIGFFVTCTSTDWPFFSSRSIRGWLSSTSTRVEGDVAAVQHAVLRRADVDERRFHPGQDVLHPAQVDVAVDRGVVGLERADVVLDQAAALEHADVRGARRPARARPSCSARPDDPCGSGRAAARGPCRRARRARPPRRRRRGRRARLPAAVVCVAAPPPRARPRPRPPRRRRRFRVGVPSPVRCRRARSPLGGAGRRVADLRLRGR